MSRPSDVPIRPAPPKYPPKQKKTTTQTSQYATAVLAMVDDVTNPTVATVYINNTLPPDDGYAIPSNIGVTFQEAPNPFADPPVGIAYYNNTTTLDGGSNVTVDVVNKILVHIDQGVSNAAPTNPSDLFQYIRHDGAYNTTGNFQNPAPIDRNQLTAVTGAISFSGVSLGTPHLAGTTVGWPLSFTVTYSDPKSNIGSLMFKAAPTSLTPLTSSTAMYGVNGAWGGGQIPGSQLVNSNATQTVNLNNLPVGESLDIWAFLVGNDGSFIYPTTNPIATVTASSLPASAMPKMPAGATFTATNISIFAADSGMARQTSTSTDSLLAPVLHVWFTLNESTNPDFSQWANSAKVYLRPYSTTQSQTDKSTYEAFPNAALLGYFTNGKQILLYARPVTNGQQYDVAVSILDGQNNETPLVYLGNYTVAQVKNGNPIGRIVGPGHLYGGTDNSITTPITLKHIGDDSGSGRFAVATIDGNRKAIIDFNSTHLNQGALSKKNQASLTSDVTGVLPRGNTDTSLTNAIDANSNLLTTEFSGQTKGINSGTYAGLQQMTVATLTSTSKFQLKAGVYLWQEWVAWCTGASTFGYGPAIVDDNGNYFVVDSYSGTGELYYNTTPIASLAPNSANNGQPHHFKLGFAYISGANPTAVWSIVAYIDDVLVYSGQYTGNFVGFARPGFRADAANSVYFRDFECTVGTRPYEQHAAAVTNALDAVGALKSSGSLKVNIPNSTAWQTDIVLHWSSSGTSPNITMTFWYDNGTASTPCYIYLPDGTTINMGYTTSGSGVTLAGVTSGTPIYVLAYWANGSMTLQASKTAFSQSQVNAAYADGGYVAVNATTQASSSISGGGSGSHVGGGINQHNNF